MDRLGDVLELGCGEIATPLASDAIGEAVFAKAKGGGGRRANEASGERAVGVAPYVQMRRERQVIAGQGLAVRSGLSILKLAFVLL
jgi:hypothetical protein